MTIRRTLLISLLVTALVWSFFSWPLPRYAHTGIPSSSANIEQNSVRRMIMGDHLQLLYYYWLSADTMTGNTEPFCNPYEFNTGSDEDRKYFGFDNAFFSAIFTFGYLLAGRAAGWNLMGFVSLWITYAFTWLLLGNYTKNRTLPPLVAMIAIALPYRWHMLLGGSPAGLAMAWVPMLLWGLDALIRRHSRVGALLAGLAIFFAYWNDVYVLFFSMMLGPCWAALVLLHHDKFPWKSAANWKRIAVAAIPLILLLASVVVMAKLKHAGVAAVESDAGRNSWQDVLLSSPKPYGLHRWRAFGNDSIIYLGFIVPLTLLAGLLIQAVLLVRRPREGWRHAAFFILLCAGLTGIVIMALGARGPADGKLFSLVRELLPPYGLVRQPAKIFTIFPPLLAVAVVISLSRILGTFPRAAKAAVPCLAALALLATLEYGLQVRPTVCLLDTEQPAYEAVAQDARSRGEEPHAMVLPIWPGSSAWASLYEHYVSIYRIRMLNGYLPVVPRDYVENVYEAFDSCTSGAISEAQLLKLRQMKVDYVILHENAFPEKVSGYPVAFAIKRLINHPWLDLLRQHDGVWAFRIRETAAERPQKLAHWNRFFPAGHAIRECEWHAPSEPSVCSDTTASGDRFVKLDSVAQETLEVPFYLSRTVKPTLQLRAAGHGELLVETLTDDATHTQSLVIASDSWKWGVAPLPVAPADGEALLRFTCTAGAIKLDMLLTAAGESLLLSTGEIAAIPAPLFFHAGYTDLDRDGVVLRVETEPDNELFYGPNLPLATGRYRLHFTVESEAPAETLLGSVRVTCGDLVQGPFPVLAGAANDAEITMPTKNLPVRIAFKYARQADMIIDKVMLERLE